MAIHMSGAIRQLTPGIRTNFPIWFNNVLYWMYSGIFYHLPPDIEIPIYIPIIGSHNKSTVTAVVHGQFSHDHTAYGHRVRTPRNCCHTLTARTIDTRFLYPIQAPCHSRNTCLRRHNHPNSRPIHSYGSLHSGLYPLGNISTAHPLNQTILHRQLTRLSEFPNPRV